MNIDAEQVPEYLSEAQGIVEGFLTAFQMPQDRTALLARELVEQLPDVRACWLGSCQAAARGSTALLARYDWERIFKDPMTTMVAIDQVVHHAVILDMMGSESYRATEASAQKAGSALA